LTISKGALRKDQQPKVEMKMKIKMKMKMERCRDGEMEREKDLAIEKAKWILATTTSR